MWQTEGQMGQLMDEQMDRQKNNVAFAHPYFVEKGCSKFG